MSQARDFADTYRLNNGTPAERTAVATTSRNIIDPTNVIGVGMDSSGNLALTGATTLGMPPRREASKQAVTAAGAINLTTGLTTVATSGAIALTLADGAAEQRKTILMITDGGDATITPAHFANGSTITMNDVFDCVELLFTNSKWYLTSNVGATIA